MASNPPSPSASSRSGAGHDVAETEGFVSLVHVLSDSANDPSIPENRMHLTRVEMDDKMSEESSSLPDVLDPNALLHATPVSPKAILSPEIAIFPPDAVGSFPSIPPPGSPIRSFIHLANADVEASKAAETSDESSLASSLVVEPSSFVSLAPVEDLSLMPSSLESVALLDVSKRSNESSIYEGGIERGETIRSHRIGLSSTSFTSLADLEPPERADDVGFSFQDYWSHVMHRRSSKPHDSVSTSHKTPPQKHWFHWPNFDFNTGSSTVPDTKFLESPMDVDIGKSILNTHKSDIESNPFPRITSISDYDESLDIPFPPNFAIPPELFHAGYEESIPRRSRYSQNDSEFGLEFAYTGEPRPELAKHFDGDGFCFHFQNTFPFSKWATILSLFNSMVGSGLFLMPWIISESGVIFGSSLLLIVGCICCYGALQTSRLGEDYDDISEVVENIWGKKTSKATLFLSFSVLFALAIVYSMILVSSLSSTMDGLIQLSGVLNTTVDTSLDPDTLSSLDDSFFFHSQSRSHMSLPPSVYDHGLHVEGVDKKHEKKTNYIHQHYLDRFQQMRFYSFFLFNYSLYTPKFEKAWSLLHHLEIYDHSVPFLKNEQRRKKIYLVRRHEHPLQPRPLHLSFYFNKSEFGIHQSSDVRELLSNATQRKKHFGNSTDASISRPDHLMENRHPSLNFTQSYSTSFFRISLLFLSTLIALIYLFPFALSNNPYSLAKFNVLGTFGLLYLSFFMVFIGFNLNITLVHPSFLVNGNFYVAGAALVSVFYLQHAAVSISKTPENRKSVESTLVASYGLSMAFLLIPGIGGAFILLVSTESTSDAVIPLPTNFLDALPNDSLATIAARIAAMWQAFSMLPSLIYIVQLQLSAFLVDICVPSTSVVSSSVTLAIVISSAVFQYFEVGIACVLGTSGALGGIYLTIFLPILLKIHSLRQARRLTTAHKIIYPIILFIGVLLFVGEFV